MDSLNFPEQTQTNHLTLQSDHFPPPPSPSLRVGHFLKVESLGVRPNYEKAAGDSRFMWQRPQRRSAVSPDTFGLSYMHAAPPPAFDCIKKIKYDCGCWSCPLWRGFTRTLRLRACLKTYYTRLHSSLYIMYSEYASVGCRDSGSCGFLISPSVLYLSEALSEGQNHISPNEKAIVDPFLHLVLPDSFSPRKHLSLCVPGGL